MADKYKNQKFCLEFADFPDADMPWLIEKAKEIEESMGQRLDGAFDWYSVVAHPEIDGFRVFFQINTAGTFEKERVPEVLLEIIREKVGDDLLADDQLAA